MWVFIDESGDPGLEINKGASPVFVLLMVKFDKIEDVLEAERVIKALRRDGYDREFRFAKSSRDIKDKFFAKVSALNFTIHYVVEQKKTESSSKSKRTRSDFNEMIVNKLLILAEEVLINAVVTIDGTPDRYFRRKLFAIIRSKSKRGVFKTVKYRDSESDYLIQLADMCAGAVARSYRLDREDRNRWHDLLQSKIRRQETIADVDLLN